MVLIIRPMQNKFLYQTTSLVLFCMLVILWIGISAYQNTCQPAAKYQDINSKPEPSGWFAGDIHVHRSCNGSTAIPDSELKTRMGTNDLAVISVLSDIGNSQAKQLFTQSGWLCARRTDSTGHKIHTSSVFIKVNNLSVRASADDARFFISWIDNILENIAPGKAWNQYFTDNLDMVQKRYRQARAVYEIVALEASGEK